MKLIHLAPFVALTAVPSAAISVARAADVAVSRTTLQRTWAQRPPLALRNLSRLSASVLASMPCWRDCTTQCGWSFQGCLRQDRLDICLGGNNQCELFCLKQCRPLGGPLVSWTDY
jgi:hypothetical protein